MHLITHTLSLPLAHRLVVFLARSRNNNVVDLEDHSAELCGKHKLLPLADKRIDDEGLLHVVGAATHAIDTKTTTTSRILDLLGLDLGEGSDGVETTVLGESHGDGVESVGEGAHGVLLEAGRLDGSVLNGQAAGNFRGTTTVDNAVVTDKVAHDAKGVVEGTLSLIDDLGNRS